MQKLEAAGGTVFFNCCDLIMLPAYVALSIPVELLFLLFHVTVGYFIVHQIAKKKSTFVSAFYVLYSLKSFADVGMYMTVRTNAIRDGTDLWIMNSEFGGVLASESDSETTPNKARFPLETIARLHRHWPKSGPKATLPSSDNTKMSIV